MRQVSRHVHEEFSLLTEVGEPTLNEISSGSISDRKGSSSPFLLPHSFCVPPFFSPTPPLPTPPLPHPFLSPLFLFLFFLSLFANMGTPDYLLSKVPEGHWLSRSSPSLQLLTGTLEELLSSQSLPCEEGYCWNTQTITWKPI